VTVTPAQFAALRAALTGDEETFERLTAAADFLNGEGFPILVATAFVTAVERRFPPGWSRGDVVRFVGQLRARNEGAHENLSATAAEQMLLSVLRKEPVAREFDENAKSIAQVALLTELVSDLTEQELGAFLAEAREQADAWLAQHGVQ
jgi:molybdopterin converting factor small subunit